MHNYFLIYLAVSLLFISSCNKYHNQQEIKGNDIIKSHFFLGNLDNKRVSQDNINPPIGFSNILLEDVNSDSIVKRFDSAYIDYDKFCKSFHCNKRINYDSTKFKEDYFENYTVYEKYSLHRGTGKDSIIQFILSSKYIRQGALSLKLAIEKSKSSNGTDLSIFLVSIKNNNIIESKRIYYNEIREMGYTYGRRFYIDKNMIISTRDYAFTEEGIRQIPLYQYQVNTEGKFIRYFNKNGNFKNSEEQGVVINYTQDRKWIEKKTNRYVGGYTWLESEFKEGLPVGEWKYYNLEQKYNDDGEPILSTRKKGQLIYTEIYEDGELKERKFIK